MRIRNLLAGTIAAISLAAAPLAAQEALVIRGGTVHPVSGDSFVGDVVVSDGKIAAVGPGAAAPQGARVIDATGLHVYPGLFDAGTTMGLNEHGRGVDVSNDMRELGRYKPHLQARTAVFPASEHIPVARANGITHVLSLPAGLTGFPGQGSIFHLAGWTIEEMDIEPSAVMVLQWPTRRNGVRPNAATRLIRDITAWLEAARAYDRVSKAGENYPRDQRLEALARVTRGEVPIMTRVDHVSDIRDVIRFAERQKVRLIIAGGREAHKAARLLAEKDVPVILGPTQSLPTNIDAPYDEPYRAPGILHEAGVKFAFATFSSTASRTLPYEAAMGIPYGLPRDAALRAITINAAEILGLGSSLGTIEPGKIANLIVSDGDPLEITTRVRHLIIAGKETSTMNKHERLYQTYRSRGRTELIP